MLGFPTCFCLFVLFCFEISCENVTNLHNFLGVRVCVISFFTLIFRWRVGAVLLLFEGVSFWVGNN